MPERRGAVCNSVLQCVAVCCSVLQCVHVPVFSMFVGRELCARKESGGTVPSVCVRHNK